MAALVLPSYAAGMNTALTRERLRRMAHEIEVGTLMAEKTLPTLPDPQNLGAFSGVMHNALKPDPNRAAREAIARSREDGQFLLKLVAWLEAQCQ